MLFGMNAIAAVVLGGTSLAGARGTITDTLIGAFVVTGEGRGYGCFLLKKGVIFS